jgi:hypothetical protein
MGRGSGAREGGEGIGVQQEAGQEGAQREEEKFQATASVGGMAG